MAIDQDLCVYPLCMISRPTIMVPQGVLVETPAETLQWHCALGLERTRRMMNTLCSQYLLEGNLGKK